MCSSIVHKSIFMNAKSIEWKKNKKQTKQIKNYSPRRAKIPFPVQVKINHPLAPSIYHPFARAERHTSYAIKYSSEVKRQKQSIQIARVRATTIGTIIADLLERQIWLIIVKHRCEAATIFALDATGAFKTSGCWRSQACNGSHRPPPFVAFSSPRSN